MNRPQDNLSKDTVRVLHVVGESSFGGASVIIWELARRAQDMGWAVDVLTTDPVFANLLKSSRIGVVSLDAVRREIRPIQDLRGLFRLYRFLKRHPYSLVQTHTSKGGFIGRLAAWLAGTPVIVHTVHGFAFHEQSGPLTSRCYVTLERLAAHWCHRIITVSEFHRRWALALGIGNENQVMAIPNGIPLERVKAGRDRGAVRAECGTALDEFVILCTGRLAKAKGHQYLLDAIASLRRDQARSFCVWLAGDGPLRAALEQKTAELGLSAVVRFLGFRADVGDLLAASDLVVLPSLWEGLSISLLEAMAAGKPVIATDIGSNVEVARNGEGAQLVPPCDPAGLARAITEVMKDPQLGERLAAAGRRIFLAHFTQERMLNRYAEEYRRLVLERLGEPVPTAKDSHGKRTLDVILAGVALLVLSPLMVCLALGVRLTSAGRAWFRQQRLGRGGVPFTLYKFRTMVASAPDLRNPDGSTFNAPDDPRVTSLGRLLRASSLDELPQLINVLKGDMSLVGPRPELPDQIRFYSDTDKRRLMVRPGITGLAQLNGRNALAWGQRRQFDLEYVEQRSLWLDLAILFRTLPYVLRRKGVYGTRQPEPKPQPELKP